MIAENVKKIRQEIAEAAKEAGRDPAEICLIGVTKTATPAQISELLDAGVTDLGENRVQDFLPKYEAFPQANWHFIGHLQRNKVKYIVDKVTLIHSVDTLPLAIEINRQGEKINKIVNILAEVNIANEASKFGLKPEAVVEFAKNVATLPFVKLRGLMTVAPILQGGRSNRAYFRLLNQMALDCQHLFEYNQRRCLSCGMSDDFADAILEGSTYVRIGTALLR